ncbi:uncharacterized protein [Drosophila tropicalis]|uniref:uncharacterized protein n=1 Tax=Drosophila tropicalis TaxID=46794 RepID=UPI0035AC0C48
MCGGWACCSYGLACSNPPLSTLRYTGRNFTPTPCGAYDNCSPCCGGCCGGGGCC